jgi:hypothetical protein
MKKNYTQLSGIPDKSISTLFESPGPATSVMERILTPEHKIICTDIIIRNMLRNTTKHSWYSM